MTKTEEVVNVICMKWGSKYTAHDVNILQSMVKRHLSLPHRFVCLTDDTEGVNSDVECLPMPEIFVPAHKDISPWRKLGMFSAQIGDLRGKALFLDLDIVIVEDIDCFFSYSDKFSIIENWTQMGSGVGNSSVYCFTLGAHTDVLEYYNDNIDKVTSEHKNEQIYLSKKIGDIDFWPESWCKSFKHHCIPPYIIRYFKTPAQPEGVKIAVFHGNPKPEDAARGGFYGNLLKYCKPTKWIKDHWC